MGYPVLPTKGLHFSFGPWPNCVIAAYDAGVGDVIFVGVGADGAADYNSIGFIFGPGDMASAVAAAGSLGAFLMSLMPAANGLMAAYLDKHPTFAPVPGNAPPTLDNVNTALQQYFQISPSSDGDYPVMSFKPYP
jgi:hypothetical protein